MVHVIVTTEHGTKSFVLDVAEANRFITALSNFRATQGFMDEIRVQVYDA